jgi:hypothetical protein
MHARLRVVRGPYSDETIQVLPGKLLIGRETDCRLRLDSKSVSAHHCVLMLDEYTLRIRDLGSTNGTLVNGIRIGKHESILLHDDTVSIDNLTFPIDLGQAMDQRSTAADVRPDVSPNALDATGIFDGDTDPIVPAQVVLTDVVEPSSDQALFEDALSDPGGAPNGGGPVRLQHAASMGSEGRGAVSKSPTVPCPNVSPPKRVSSKAAEQAIILPNQSSQSADKQKEIVKPKEKGAGKTEQGSKKSSSTGIGWALPIGGLIVSVGFVAGGVFFLRGSGQGAKFEAPKAYVLFNPKSFEMLLTCEAPENWKQQFRGGNNVGPIWARFTNGPVSIEIGEALTGEAIRQAVAAMQKNGKPIRHDVPTVEQIHEYQRPKSSENFRSYDESPRSRGIKTKGYGEARISDFTATEGFFGTEASGCRATALNLARQITVTCKCPPSQFEDAKPVFEKVIASLGFEPK